MYFNSRKIYIPFFLYIDIFIIKHKRMQRRRNVAFRNWIIKQINWLCLTNFIINNLNDEIYLILYNDISVD